MSVPKGKRNKSKFETEHHLTKMRNEITALLMNNFGYSEEKFQKQIDNFARTLPYGEEKSAEILDRWIAKRRALHEWFIESERDAVIQMLRDAAKEFTMANSIYPSETEAKLEEYKERRIHLDLAIGHCFELTDELQYVIDNLPVNANKYKVCSDLIEEQINLFKGVRQADNRFLKPKKIGGKKKSGKVIGEQADTENIEK